MSNRGRLRPGFAEWKRRVSLGVTEMAGYVLLFIFS